ncbi:hypothetical protein [Paraglaciecola sp. 25GB23A]|uniref:hypothetical protein n=1 Tax=Paraglaciecola sp. 25GB23A TaxID=3156068 RepID=UPI0032B00C4F
MSSNLEQYIKENFYDNKSAFARFMGVTSQQVSKWIRHEWIVEGNELCAPKREIPEFVKVTNEFRSSQLLPLYCMSGCTEEPAYLTLDIQHGDIDVHVGHNRSLEMATCRVLMFPINPRLTTQQITDCIESRKPLFQAILTGSSIEYDNNNFRGKFNEDADFWIEELEQSLFELDDADEVYILDAVDPIIEDDPFGLEINAKSLTDMADFVKLKAKESEVVFSDDLMSSLEQDILSFYNYLASLEDDLDDFPDWVKKLLDH